MAQAFNYSRSAEAARRLLARFGREAVLRKARPSQYDPGSATVEVGKQDFQVLGALFSYVQQDIDGTVIHQGDQRFLMAPELLLRPEPGDEVLIDLQVFSVVSVKATEPAGVTVIYDLQLRGVIPPKDFPETT